MIKIDNYYQVMTKLHQRLEDEESRVLFEARINYIFSKDKDECLEA